MTAALGWTMHTQLHQRAHDVATKLCKRFAQRLPEDVRSVVSFWQSSLLAGDQAAGQLIGYGRRFGVHPDPPAAAADDPGASGCRR